MLVVVTPDIKCTRYKITQCNNYSNSVSFILLQLTYFNGFLCLYNYNTTTKLIKWSYLVDTVTLLKLLYYYNYKYDQYHCIII